MRFFRSFFATPSVDRNGRFGVFDVHCGHAEVQSDFGYDVFKTDTLKGRSSKPLRLLSLGGSTTSWRHGEGGMWARDVSEILRQLTGRPVELFNGGVAGYSSSQELMKLVRDAQGLAPHLVLSLSGINDIGSLHSVPNFPFVHPHAHKNARLFLRRGDFKETILGWPNKQKKSAIWIRNQQVMSAVAHMHGALFFGFLQPIMGVGSPDLSIFEEEDWRENQARPLEFGTYSEALKEFYAEVGESLPSGQVRDISCSLDGETNVFRDFRHQNRKGDGIIARAIVEEIPLEDLR